ncbi:redox-sensing transcriptional repressor Rex [Clostridium tyrobutyricum]|jgi:redox-sensing transcriptional repressor|uniref:Redox-sensing transcriptional repressor Rex n=1 Tax=Clostridium tyrobutyricum DIVETGP TaxID=1408889 RepID=W6N627_CLOTY|nr:redox-sensing transcriptional repressor Rex [Clostridium tyrobutyricum]AND85882.1 redox-sensing transcriptional repressor rex [Clostridium tyrobutyricum]ANP70395.1 redox-sensing transcriptional repressor Rex [Clostridium tyrobutyricum]MBR9648219.1 redox-sensing transcriptional repressor Rex [Clostridium tyrobutyricum]MBV4414637.1 redox-sensing transcriptional repressor Rex [Clostridium tyrobutyricum]MBV4422616.1 redox-sensing transcriptional repressor Rex [Clostridium tyrobutyricum]
MDKKKNISMAVIKRLPKYHRYLGDLMKNDVDRISSKELSETIGFTASQIRQDLNCFGDFGQQGYGYNVSELYSQIRSILGLTKVYNTAIIGAGNIGQALANYTRFEKLGFKLKIIFDINPKLVGIRIQDIEIKDIDYLTDYLKQNPIDIGILCVPNNSAQKVCDILIKNGVRGIWNFAPVDLVVPKDIKVENVHLSDSLLTLSCLLNDIE